MSEVSGNEDYGRLVAEGWDKDYREGWSDGKAPEHAFIDLVLSNLAVSDARGYGLYIGCGDGRNYLEILRRNPELKLHGTDIAPEAIARLRERAPQADGKTFVSDFTHYHGANIFNYLIALQTFQHGDRATTDRFFANSREALKPGGKLFLRVNSVSTEIAYPHRRAEGTKRDGFIIQYTDDHKQGQFVHFYSRSELGKLATKHAFTVLHKPTEAVHQRADGSTWSQWETIWQKHA